MHIRPATGTRGKMLYGYARVSAENRARDGMNLEIQLEKLAHCDQVFQDIGSGRDFSRVDLNNLIATVENGDRVEVVALDRLGRHVARTTDVIDDIADKGATIWSQREGKIDPHLAQPRMMMTLVLMMAEFEHNVGGERTRASVQNRRSRGEYVGNKWSVTRVEAEHIQDLLAKGGSVNNTAKVTGHNRRLIQRIRDINIPDIHPDAWRK